MHNVLSVILGGGKGTRLYPLTKNRAKPAVPFGAKYRLVDIPISNCINAGFKKIFILTQFNSASLHMHLSQAYLFDSFTRGFVEILAAEQTFENNSWYQGTADAVRKNMNHFRSQNPSHYLILSGDQLYRMDLEDFLQKHIESGADVTVAATPVPEDQVSGFGIMRVNKTGGIEEFVEKPGPEYDLNPLKIPANLHPDKKMKAEGREYLASMGIYCFSAKAMEEALDSEYTDFGKEIIPEAITNKKVQSYVFTGFWEDIGTIKSFYETNLNIASINPDFNIYDEERPIYTHMRHLPASKFNFSTLSQTLTADGCIITNASLTNSIVGLRTLIESGASLDGVICMGADYYETNDQKQQNAKKGIPNIGIGRSCLIKKAIIDKNARIGDNCRIGVDPIERIDGEYDNHYIKDGIIVVPKNTALPPGTIL